MVSLDMPHRSTQRFAASSTRASTPELLIPVADAAIGAVFDIG
jgi:hypothetical protein